MIMFGLTEVRSTGSTLWVPRHLSSLAMAHSELGQFDDASHSICELLTMLERKGKNGARQKSVASPAISRSTRLSTMQ